MDMRNLHPLVVIAALSVIVFGAGGVALVTGLLPGPRSSAGTGDTVSSEAPNIAAAPATGQATGVAWDIGGNGQTRAENAKISTANTSGRVAPAATCRECGVVASITAIEQPGQPTGAGAIAGGIAGALLGNQIGQDTTRTVTTILGGAGGAYAGHTIEKNYRRSIVYRITVRMDDGTYRTVSQYTEPVVLVGQRVKVVDGVIVAAT